MLHFLTSDAFVHAFQTYGLLALFGVVLLESMGIPLPGETALVSSAIYAGSTHEIGIVGVVAAAAAGAIVGDNLGYLVGRFVGLRLLLRYGSYVRLDEKRLKLGEYLFLRHGGKIVFFGRFVAVLRAYAALLAGTNRMHWRHFLIMNALGAILWASLFGGGAYVFGGELRRVAEPFVWVVLVVAIVLVVAGFLFVKRHEKELEARAEAALPGPLGGSI